jgi:hypothetical protein
MKPEVTSTSKKAIAKSIVHIAQVVIFIQNLIFKYMYHTDKSRHENRLSSKSKFDFAGVNNTTSLFVLQL